MGKALRLLGARLSGQGFNVREDFAFMGEGDGAQIIIKLIMLGHSIDKRAAIKMILAKPIFEQRENALQARLWGETVFVEFA